MSTFFYGGQHHQQQHHHQVQHPHPMPQSHNHHGRSRRAPRLSSAQNSHRQFRGPKIVKEVVVSEAPSMTAYRARFEAGRSFDLDDDLEFCPNLLTFDEVCDDSYDPRTFLADLEKRQSVTSGSDRSSLSSGSPSSSPLQTQIQPHQITPALSISSAATSAYMSPPSFTSNNNNSLKIHQPSAIRSSRTSAIPIVNPSTGNRIASPPSSISPGMMQQTTMARRW